MLCRASDAFRHLDYASDHTIQATSSDQASFTCKGNTLLVPFHDLQRVKADKVGLRCVHRFSVSMRLLVLRPLLENCQGLQGALTLLNRSRRSNTKIPYNSKMNHLRFDHFCKTIQDDAGAPRFCPLPASPATILAYMGFLAQEGKVKAGSLQPYLPEINSAHADLDSTNLHKVIGLFSHCNPFPSCFHPDHT